MKRKKLNMDKMYKFYIKHPERHKMFNDQLFYLLAGYEPLKIGDKETLILYICSDIDYRIGKILIDENGNEFTITGVEMVHYTNNIPVWSALIVGLQVEPKLVANIGKYITLKESV